MCNNKIMKKFAPKETMAYLKFLRGLKIARRKTKRLVAVVMIGLVGSGKSSVARAIAAEIGGTVIEADAIRMKLRDLGAGYDKVRQIAEAAAREVFARRGNLVIDSDFVDGARRKSAAAFLRKAGARIYYVRVIAEGDIMIGRTVYNAPSLFFRGATTNWRGSERERGAVVKLREFWRRTPRHYIWNPKSGGNWKLKPIAASIAATIDTTDGKSWRKAAARLAKKLI